MTLFGWQPPVATLLECASRFQQRLEQGGVKNFTVVDPAEMYLVIAQLIRLHRAGYESSAVALGLVTHLFTASGNQHKDVELGSLHFNCLVAFLYPTKT